MSKKLKKKTSAILMASILAMASIPMASSLPVYADEYNGGSEDISTGFGSTENGIAFADYGFRVYAIDSDGHIKTGNGGKYVIDLWNTDSHTSVNTIKQKTDKRCRYGNISSADNIYIDTFETGIADATTNLKYINAISDSLTSIPAFSTSINNEFKMSGETFKGWATTKVQSTLGMRPSGVEPVALP